MRALVQRVTTARVSSCGRLLGEIGQGMLVLVGVGHQDDEAVARKMAQKIARLRVFDDDSGRMNLSVGEVRGSVLAVSQFTLYGDAGRGNRPSYMAAARPDQASPLFDSFATALRGLGIAVQTGEFGAHMSVELVNDGPVTLWLDSEEL